MPTAFVPCRSGSERVKNKNLRPFGGEEFGLFGIKLGQLSASKRIERIIVSTNDEAIISACEALRPSVDKELIIDRRPEEFATSLTSTDDLIKYAIGILPEDVILWTHVTSPFVEGARYDEMFDMLDQQKGAGYDSLVSAGTIRTFLWNKFGPLNYDRTVEKWPRTQTLEPVYEINSAAFIAPLQTMKRFNDRIGEKPYLFTLTSVEHLDIDWEEDFVKAEEIWRKSRTPTLLEM